MLPPCSHPEVLTSRRNMHVSHRALPQAAQGLAAFKMPAGWSPNQLAIYGWCMDNDSHGTVHAAGSIRIIHYITWVRLLWGGLPYESSFQWRHSEVRKKIIHMQGHRNISKLCGNTLKSCADMDTIHIHIYIYMCVCAHYMDLIWTCVGIWWFFWGKKPVRFLGICLKFLKGYLLFNGRFPECGGANAMQIGMIDMSLPFLTTISGMSLRANTSVCMHENAFL